MFTEARVPVGGDSRVELFTAQTAGPDDRALLVIHGGPDWDHSYLRDPLCRLAGEHRVVMADMRGCGRSTSGLPPGAYTPDNAVGDFAALLDALGLVYVDVLGFSYGGLIAQRLALAHPGRVRRLIVASSSVLPVPGGAFDGWAERDSRRAEGVAAMAAMEADPPLPGPELTRAWAVAFAAADVWRRERLPGYLQRLAQMRFTASWLEPWRSGTLPPARPPDAAAGLAGLGLPILLLHGSQDMTFPASLARAAQEIIPSAQAVVLADAGHMAHVDEPELWLAAIRDFLRTGRPPDPPET
ncbi:MAG: alpha/beta hydrolase [Streptosporangiales bacterium]|nr:alpha/beta hydrolase [Streptosporangiales bacterium]